MIAVAGLPRDAGYAGSSPDAIHALVAKLVDAPDSESGPPKGGWRFESSQEHHRLKGLYALALYQ